MIRHPEGGEAAKDLLSCHPDLVAGKALKLSGSLRAPFFEHRSLMKMRITAEKMYTKGAKYGTMYKIKPKWPRRPAARSNIQERDRAPMPPPAAAAGTEGDTAMHEGHRQRIRSRLYQNGEALSDCELLELLLFNAISRKDTNPIARELLDCFGSLAGVFDASPRLLVSVAGIGRSTAEYVYLCGQLLRRAEARKEEARRRLMSFSDVHSHVCERFAGRLRERLELYMVDANFLLLCTKSVTDIRADEVALDMRTLGYILGEVRPYAVILAHNHPSGKPEPSAADDASVRRIAAACKDYGAHLSDSLIYAAGEVYSYYRADRLRALGID